jgi:hypothetical protein
MNICKLDVMQKTAVVDGSMVILEDGKVYNDYIASKFPMYFSVVEDIKEEIKAKLSPKTKEVVKEVKKEELLVEAPVADIVVEIEEAEEVKEESSVFGKLKKAFK